MGVFLTLFVAASLPVVKVVLLCGVGAICARTGLLSYDGRKVLSGMAYIVFVPALNFTNLATSITPSRLLLWWPLVVNLFLSTGLGAGLGYLNAALVRPAPWFKNHTVAAVMFGNVGNLPLVIVATLARSSASILGGVDPEEATKLAISYVVLGLLAPILMQPTIGYRMLAKAPAADDNPLAVSTHPSDLEHVPLLLAEERSAGSVASLASPSVSAVNHGRDLGPPSAQLRPPSVQLGHPAVPSVHGERLGNAAAPLFHKQQPFQTQRQDFTELAQHRALSPASSADHFHHAEAGVAVHCSNPEAGMQIAELPMHHGAPSHAPPHDASTPTSYRLSPLKGPAAHLPSLAAAQSRVAFIPTSIPVSVPPSHPQESHGCEQTQGSGQSQHRSIASSTPSSTPACPSSSTPHKYPLKPHQNPLQHQDQYQDQNLNQNPYQEPSLHQNLHLDPSQHQNQHLHQNPSEHQNNCQHQHQDPSQNQNQNQHQVPFQSQQHPSQPHQDPSQPHQDPLQSQLDPLQSHVGPSQSHLDQLIQHQDPLQSQLEILQPHQDPMQQQQQQQQPHQQPHQQQCPWPHMAPSLRHQTVAAGLSDKDGSVSPYQPHGVPLVQATGQLPLVPATSQLPWVSGTSHQGVRSGAFPHQPHSAALEPAAPNTGPGAPPYQPHSYLLGPSVEAEDSGLFQRDPLRVSLSRFTPEYLSVSRFTTESDSSRGPGSGGGGGFGPSWLHTGGGRRGSGRPLPRFASFRGEAGRRLLCSASRRTQSLLKMLVKELISPPIISVVLGIFVGCVRPLQELFFKPDAPLQIMTDTLTMLGDCAIPVMIISLGATLSKGPGAARVPVRVIASVGVCRLVILPLVGMAVVMGSYAAGVFKAPDPIFLLVLLIQNTAPTAIMVHTMAAVHQNGDEEVSSVLFWQYLVSIVTIPPYLLLFMYIVRQVF